MAAALLAHLPGQREEVTDLAATLQALTQHLQTHRPLWSARPFVTHTVAWEAEAPAEAAWARALSEDAVEAGEADPSVLPGCPPLLLALRAAAQAMDLPFLDGPPPPSATTSPEGVPLRKWSQIEPYADRAAARLGDAPAFVEWCAGKGHLGRSLHRRTGRPICSVERDPALCEAGALLAGDQPQRFVAADVLHDPLDALPEEAAIVGLHACGRLGDAALRRARARQAPVALAPCCYHNSEALTFTPLSEAGRALDLGLHRDDLRLPSTEEVVASARVRRLRRAELRYRKALDLLLRRHSGVDRYTPVGHLPPSALTGSFADFLAAVRLRRPVPDEGPDAAALLAEAEVWVRQSRALGLFAAPFRRPLELWLVLDKALFLAEAGYAVTLGRFCHRIDSPRDLLLLATPPGHPEAP